MIAVAHRPVHGANGDYRATLRHAVSRVRSGERVGLSLPLDGLPAPP
ncbi:2OG-Fe(II) oxygenase [Achromobacter xylosoxidans]